MTRLILTLPLARLALAPPDATRGEGSGPVAEIVTFRLAPGVTDADFLDAARATGPLLASEPGFLSRRLSRGRDGTWTDHVVWTGLVAAEAAAARVMATPEAAPFLAAIDPASIVMRHERLVLTTE